MQAGNLHAVEPRDVAVVRLDLQRAGAEQRGSAPELAPDVDGRVAFFMSLSSVPPSTSSLL